MSLTSKYVLSRNPLHLRFLLLLLVLHQLLQSTPPCAALRSTASSNRSLTTSSAAQRKPRTRVYIGVLLPVDNDRPFSIQKCLPAIQHAFISDRVKAVLPGFEFLTVNANSKCNSIAAPIEAFNMMAIEKVQVFFGPVCDYSLAPVARYTPYWDIPVISPGGMAIDFGEDKRAEYPLLTRVGFTFEGVAEGIYKVVQSYEWKDIKVLYSADGHSEIANRFCYLAMHAVLHLFQDEDVEHHIFMFEHMEEDEDMEKMLIEEVGVEYAIVVLCASPDEVRNLMIKASQLNFDNGDYVFINVDLFSSKTLLLKPWYRENDTEERNDAAKKAYETLLTVTLRQPPESAGAYAKFSEAVKRRAKLLFDESVFKEDEEVNSFVGAFHDAVLLYALALNETLREGYSVANGTIITHKMWNRTINGITGVVKIDENGDRKADYSILDMNPDSGEFHVVANYFSSSDSYELEPERTIHWGGERTTVPRHVPECGYDGSKCIPPDVFPEYTIAIIVLATLVISVSIVAVLLYHHYKMDAALAETNWRIRWDSIMFGSLEKRKLERNGSVRCSMVSISNISMSSLEIYPTEQAFTKIGSYKGCLVAIKKIGKSVSNTKPFLVELKQMRNLQHDHIVRFIGVCMDAPNYCVVTEYCQKGSLQDVLSNEHVKLDIVFKHSLIQDIVRGMAYLHSSDIRSHGNLKTSNCVVDSKFVLKITDFGFHSLRSRTQHTRAVGLSHYHRNLLWTAPELLRMENRPVDGTQKGDLYSFAIICQEIIYRKGPFWIATEQYAPVEIVARVQTGERPCLRPSLVVDVDADQDGCCHELAALINRCWAEEPNDRPDFHTLKIPMLKRSNIRDSGSLMDNLLSRLEQYAYNLEALVEERTVDYLEQKKRAEEILYLMLPRSVAVQLMYGEVVQAEKFECVTIYYSDICGFTSLCADSSPMQVVNMLNDLYTAFDAIIDTFDVYKVETIGDAYMVASGLPLKNGIQHVSEIGRMALAIVHTVKSFKIRHRPGEQLQLRTGIHSGPVCSGVVGMKMPRYCLFGDTVNTAAMMESHSLPLRIHVSPRSKELLDTFGIFHLEPRGNITFKGRGMMATWWLNSELHDHRSINRS